MRGSAVGWAGIEERSESAPKNTHSHTHTATHTHTHTHTERERERERETTSCLNMHKTIL